MVGNLGLIVINRTGASRRRWWRQPNPAFWVVTTSAVIVLSMIVCFQAPGRWFGFAPPPAGLLALAVLAPLAGLGLAEAWLTLRRRLDRRMRRV